MSWKDDVHSVCGLDMDEHERVHDDAGKVHPICPAWLTERSAA